VPFAVPVYPWHRCQFVLEASSAAFESNELRPEEATEEAGWNMYTESTPQVTAATCAPGVRAICRSPWSERCMRASGRDPAMARVDLYILHEIVRVIQVRAKVPDRVRIQKRQYLITYLDDHRQRIEEALRRHDNDRLSMLFGQLASKVKYQLLRRVASVQRGRAQTRAARPRTSPRGRTKRARSR
jgi:hypothetical protein